eukprot:1142854-Pelagomonas_calceolata.AAC.6
MSDKGNRKRVKRGQSPEQAVPMSDRALRAARRAAAADSNPEAPSSSSESDEPEPVPEQEVQKATAKPLPKTEAFWQEACRLRYPEFVKLARLFLVMVEVPGSVEDEHMFSAMKYLKNPQRNSLKEQHLTAYACRPSRARSSALPHFPTQQPLKNGLKQQACPFRTR